MLYMQDSGAHILVILNSMAIRPYSIIFNIVSGNTFNNTTIRQSIFAVDREPHEYFITNLTVIWPYEFPNE